MIMDAELKFSDAQAVTAAAASTNIVDLGAVRNIGDGEELFIVVQVHTTLGDGGSNTSTTVALQGDSSDSFSPDGTVDIASFPQAAAAGTVRIYRLSPGAAPLQYRYIRLYYTPNGANLTSGKFDAFITKNVDRFVAYADNVTIS